MPATTIPDHPEPRETAGRTVDAVRRRARDDGDRKHESTATLVYLLLFIVAFGVVWELLEFLIAESAAAFGTAQVLTQYGLDDTVLDGLLVAVFRTAHLTDVSEQLAARLDARGTIAPSATARRLALTRSRLTPCV